MKISFAVIFSHLAIITFMIYFQEPRQEKKPRSVVAVKTYVQKTQSTYSVISSIEESPKKEQAKPTVKSEVVEQKAIVLRTPSSTKKTTSEITAEKKQKEKTQTVNAGNQKLIALMQQSLHTLNAQPAGSSSQKQQALNAPTIGPLASEALSFATHYEEDLVLHLESLLSLPEKADVKLKLTLKRDGTVQNIEIVYATSEKNRKYVESTLASCSFAAFGTYFKGEATHTFSITLKAVKN